MAQSSETKGKRRAVRHAQTTKAASNRIEDNRLLLLVTVVNRKKADYFTDLIQSFEVNLQVQATGFGTASRIESRSMADPEKMVLFSVIQENQEKKCLELLRDRFRTIRGGEGIAYTIPFSSVIGKLIYGFLGNDDSVV